MEHQAKSAILLRPDCIDEQLPALAQMNQPPLLIPAPPVIVPPPPVAPAPVPSVVTPVPTPSYGVPPNINTATPLGVTPRAVYREAAPCKPKRHRWKRHRFHGASPNVVARLSVPLTGNQMVAYCRHGQGVQALADPSRRQLLDRLCADNGQTLGELCEHLAMTRQAVTKHLVLLEEANLVATVRRGREKLHYLNPVPIHEIAERWIGKVRTLASAGVERHEKSPGGE